MPYADKEAQRQYQREWLQRRRQKWIAENGPCVVCGSEDRLEVDHIDPATKLDHKVWSWSKDRREAELAKCQVLCHDHHKDKTRSENVTTEHGTYAMRNQHGCTCGECKEYVRASKARWRARQQVVF